jgi:hypothetical protein
MGMKLNGNFLFMGAEKSENREKKETYYKIGLMQGLQSRTFYVDEVNFNKYEQFTVASPVYADIEINERDSKTYYQLNGLKIVSSQARNSEKAG